MSDYKNIPPLLPKRNEFGLLENVNYIFKKDGTVDWRAMIDPIYLRVNNSYKEIVEEKYGKDYQIENVDDKYLLILLDGIKAVARLRGYEEVFYKVKPLSDNFVVAICRVDFIPNYETGQLNITFSDAADASITNCSGFGKVFLTTVSVNRAFVRTIRNFLGIQILGADEISSDVKQEIEKDSEVKSSDPHDILRDLIKRLDSVTEGGFTFEIMRDICGKKGDNVSLWTSIEDVPKIKSFELISRLTKKLEKK